MSGTRLTDSQLRRLMKWDAVTAPIHAGVIQHADIAFETTTAGTRDLALVSGIDNLRQQLTTAMATALGSDPLNARHGFAGFRALAEEGDPLLLRERLRFSVLAVLRADPRIVAVLRVLIGDEIAAWHAGRDEPVPPRAGHGVVDVEAQFTIRSGETLTVAVGPILGGA
ncbi:hypothetical protein C882_1762 [Caenispirillum salinarum AK4]|uniref:IraD/Gp25-like domain-containing protein n=1 Tax=Caenispirillum salinarum AK4 TaxID=1238182 RepID=K9GMN6_9PROT|nr:hypothetical protein [Caenispirillum salinarum]EKV27260.1 hypothetical protein C882_1762 [Caenispirillum salinarum AK4]